MNNKPVFVSEKKPHADMDGAEFELVIIHDEHGFTIIQRDYEDGVAWNATPVSSHPTMDEAKRKAAEYLAQV